WLPIVESELDRADLWMLRQPRLNAVSDHLVGRKQQGVISRDTYKFGRHDDDFLRVLSVALFLSDTEDQHAAARIGKGGDILSKLLLLASRSLIFYFIFNTYFTVNPTLHYPSTHHSIIPLFHHSNWGEAPNL
ncbi:MAG: hypothetical protein R6U40_00610, partial [Desulfobacterales bacterium]